MSIYIVNELEKIAKESMDDNSSLREAARNLERSANEFLRDYERLEDKMREAKLDIKDLDELKNEISRIIR